jgi:hypothetical protein
MTKLEVDEVVSGYFFVEHVPSLQLREYSSFWEKIIKRFHGKE